MKDLYVFGRCRITKAHATVIVLAPLSDEVYIRGDLHNTMERGTFYLTCKGEVLLNLLQLIMIMPG